MRRRQARAPIASPMTCSTRGRRSESPSAAELAGVVSSYPGSSRPAGPGFFPLQALEIAPAGRPLPIINDGGCLTGGRCWRMLETDGVRHNSAKAEPAEAARRSLTMRAGRKCAEYTYRKGSARTWERMGNGLVRTVSLLQRHRAVHRSCSILTMRNKHAGRRFHG